MAAHTVAMVLTDRLAVFDFAVPCEVFGIDRSDIVNPWYELKMCAGEPGPLHTTGGLRIDTPYGLDDVVAADTVLVPGCQRTLQIEPLEDLLDALRAAHARGARVASTCVGAYLLAAAGLLDGKRATTHWMNAPDFIWRFPQVQFDPGVLYVDEGDVLTSAGTGASIDLCLHLVRTDHGAAVANEVARRMVVPPHRDGGQAQYAQPVAGSDPHGDLAPALDWARANLSERVTVDRLAAVAHLSPRTFARRFRDTLGTTPLNWLVQQRVRLAQELLETSDEPVERIAARVGFGTAANLRQHFHRVTSVSPQTYRQVFRRRSR